MSVRRFQSPDVNVVADGANGYIVRYVDIDGSPRDVRTFGFDYTLPAVSKAAHRAEVKERAQAYRDGFAEGLFRSQHILGVLIGVGV